MSRKVLSGRIASKFLSDLEVESDEWTRVFRGLLSIMAKAVMSRQTKQDQQVYRDDPRYQNILANEPFEQFLYQKLATRKK